MPTHSTILPAIMIMLLIMRVKKLVDYDYILPVPWDVETPRLFRKSSDRGRGLMKLLAGGREVSPIFLGVGGPIFFGFQLPSKMYSLVNIAMENPAKMEGLMI